MKTIVDGKMYDNEKAECLGIVGQHHELYRTPKGKLFLVNISQQMISVTDQQIIMEHIGQCAPEKYIRLFGEVEDA